MCWWCCTYTSASLDVAKDLYLLLTFWLSRCCFFSTEIHTLSYEEHPIQIFHIIRPIFKKNKTSLSSYWGRMRIKPLPSLSFSTSYLNRTLHSLRRQIHFVCCNTKNWQVRADESPFLLNEDEWMHHLPPAGDSTCMQLQPFEPESAQSCTTSLWVSHDFIIWTPDTLWIHAMWRGDEFILIYLSTNGAQSPERNTEEASSEWTRADRWIRFCGH